MAAMASPMPPSVEQVAPWPSGGHGHVFPLALLTSRLLYWFPLPFLNICNIWVLALEHWDEIGQAKGNQWGGLPWLFTLDPDLTGGSSYMSLVGRMIPLDQQK